LTKALRCLKLVLFLHPTMEEDLMAGDNEKQRKENIQKSLEELAEASSQRSPDDEKIQQAKDKRAHAEKELVDNRTPSSTGRND